jgi:hypothetical protein
MLDNMGGLGNVLVAWAFLEYSLRALGGKASVRGSFAKR